MTLCFVDLAFQEKYIYAEVACNLTLHKLKRIKEFLFKCCASVSVSYIQTNKLCACKIKVEELIKDKHDKFINLKKIMNCWYLVFGSLLFFLTF